MSTSTLETEIKKMVRDNSVGLRNEGCMLLSTTYSLNSSDTKRIQVGLRASSEEGVFEPAIKIMGNTANGVYLDIDSWASFKESLETVGTYLSWTIKEVPKSIKLNNVSVNCTTAYGARALMVSHTGKSEDNSEMTMKRKPTCEDGQPIPSPPTKRRKLYSPNIVMQKISVEGLVCVTSCIDARLEHLQTIANHVNECARFLIVEIELNLPRKKAVDEDIVKLTLAEKYQEIERDVRRQIKDLQFLDHNFNIVFRELTSIYLNEIVRAIIMNASL